MSIKTLFYFLIIPILCSFTLCAEEEVSAPWPWMEKEDVLHIAIGPNNLRNSEGGFVTLDDGEILFVYSHFYGTEGRDHDTAYLASRSSFDGGKTWTAEDKIEVENEGGLNIMSVTLRKLADGRVAIFYAVKESSADCRPAIRIRQTDGTWGERIICVSTPSYNVVNNDRIEQLTDGRILIPCARHTYYGKSTYDYDWYADLYCAISDDGGSTWREGKHLAKRENVIYQEPGLCELADGRVLMNIRTDAGFQYFTFSSDGGETWEEANPSCLDSPLSPTLIKRIPGSDDLLAVGNTDIGLKDTDYGFRGSMAVSRLSPDGSKVLARKTLEYPDGKTVRNWEYPAIEFTGDGFFLTAYSTWDGIHIYRMNLSDLDSE